MQANSRSEKLTLEGMYFLRCEIPFEVLTFISVKGANKQNSPKARSGSSFEEPISIWLLLACPERFELLTSWFVAISQRFSGDGQRFVKVDMIMLSGILRISQGSPKLIDCSLKGANRGPMNDRMVMAHMLNSRGERGQ